MFKLCFETVCFVFRPCVVFRLCPVFRLCRLFGLCCRLGCVKTVLFSSDCVLYSDCVGFRMCVVFRQCWVQTVLCSDCVGFRPCWVQTVLGSDRVGFRLCCCFQLQELNTSLLRCCQADVEGFLWGIERSLSSSRRVFQQLGRPAGLIPQDWDSVLGQVGEPVTALNNVASRGMQLHPGLGTG